MGEFVLFHGAQLVFIGNLILVIHIVVADVETVIKSVLADFQCGGSVIMLVFAGAKTEKDNRK